MTLLGNTRPWLRPWPMVGVVMALALGASMSTPASAATFAVNTTDNVDDGSCDPIHCSLKEAILAANANPGPDLIAFDIPGAGPHVIGLGPLNPLPALTDGGTTIDGTTEPDYAGAPVIILQPWIGTPPFAPPVVPLPAEGLWIEADDTTIRGFSIVGFGPPASTTGAGIVINSGTGNLMELNYVGLDASGAAIGNGTGIRLGPIGQTVRENVISGNEIGLEIYGGDQAIHNNWIGLDPSGSSSVSNGDGIVVEGFYPPTTGPGGSLVIGGGAPLEGNVVSGNSNAGIRVTNASVGIVILGNRIGTDPDGLAAVPNEYGIVLENATGVVVGGAGSGDGNLISGNDIHGLWVKNWIGDDATVIVPSDYTQVIGNTVGLASDGSVLPNVGSGVHLDGSHHTVGGDSPGEGNILSGNGTGLRLKSGGDNTIIGNWIGTDSTGTADLGNGIGVRVGTSGLMSQNTVAYNVSAGVTFHQPSDLEIFDNAIAWNGGAGIDLVDGQDQNAFARNNTFTQNEIHDNGLLGIDLPGFDVNPNDPGDTDAGANDLLNYPEFTSLSTTSVAGTACYGCVVELFIADNDPSGHGEGMTFLTAVTAAPDGRWSAPISGVGFCTPITATATDLSGNTSEFSSNVRPSCWVLRPLVILVFVAGAVVVGATGTGLGGRILRRPIPWFAGAVGGAAVGAGLVAVALALPSVEFEVPAVPVAPSAAVPAVSSCALYLDEDNLRPAVGAVFEPNDEPVLSWDPIGPLPSGPIRWVVELQGPGGSAASQTTPSTSLELASFGTDLSLPGSYLWKITGERAQAGSDLWLPFCAGDPAHYFRVGRPHVSGAPPWIRGVPDVQTPGLGENPSTATATASLTPTSQPMASASATRTQPPPTATRTPTAVPDTSGPSIKSVSDSPDPIKATQPKGCTPNTSVVSAAISDPSGVASAEVIFFHTTIGSVPMSHGGGNTWTATLGPYTGIGDGTVDYQIRATDSQGNVTDTAFYQITVLACIP